MNARDNNSLSMHSVIIQNVSDIVKLGFGSVHEPSEGSENVLEVPSRHYQQVYAQSFCCQLKKLTFSCELDKLSISEVREIFPRMRQHADPFVCLSLHRVPAVAGVFTAIALMEGPWERS
jgi:hypothetical protein